MHLLRCTSAHCCTQALSALGSAQVWTIHATTRSNHSPICHPSHDLAQQTRQNERLQNVNGDLKTRVRQMMAERERPEASQVATSLNSSPPPASLESQRLQKENTRLRRQVSTCSQGTCAASCTQAGSPRRSHAKWVPQGTFIHLPSVVWSSGVPIWRAWGAYLNCLDHLCMYHLDHLCKP